MIAPFFSLWPARDENRGHGLVANFRRQPVPMMALAYLLCLGVAALAAPFIAGTKPVVCRYKGRLYFPALGYFYAGLENPIFFRDRFHKIYPANLKRHDPQSWALWPPVYQDPLRIVQANEWPGQPGNPSGTEDRSPNRYNLCGTTQSGIDVFAQLVHAARTALVVGLGSMALAAALGITLGAAAGYVRGWVDWLVSRLVEVVLCIPVLILILALLALVEQPRLWHITLLLGLTHWTTLARLTRAEFHKTARADFVLAARALGAGPARIIWRHLLPNCMAPLVAPLTFGIAVALLIESSLSFLGFGDPHTPSWGGLLNEGRNDLASWWLILFPGLAIFLTLLSLNLVAEGLQLAADPRSQSQRS